MALKMKYFLHDSNARNDESITMIRIKFGYEGIGLFFSILEILASQEKPVNETVLKSQLNIKKRLEKQLCFMYKIGVLSLRNGDVFSENLLNFSEKYKIKKEKTRKKVSEWRDKQGIINNVTSYKNIRNRPKVKESKVNISKIKEKDKKESVSFSKALDLYKHCFKLTTAKSNWEFLEETEKEKVILHAGKMRSIYENENKIRFLPDFSSYLFEKMFDIPIENFEDHESDEAVYKMLQDEIDRKMKIAKENETKTV